MKSLSRVRLVATLWTAAHQAPPSMGFSRQEYWSGCRCLLQETTVNRNKMVFPGGTVVKNPPAKQEMCVLSLGQEDPLEKEMATHSSILAWEIPWTEESGGLHSMGSQRVGHSLVIKQQQPQ